jgi:hypothetical protein
MVDRAPLPDWSLPGRRRVLTVVPPWHSGDAVRRVESNGLQAFLAGCATVVDELAAAMSLPADQSIRDSPG